MNTVNSVGQNLAMDGHFKYNSGAATAVKPTASIKPVDVPMADAAQVVQNITNNLAQVKEDAKQLQRLSDVVMGRKVQFNVNQELNQVVVSIVDPSTDKVIKEIPSADLQKLKVRIRKTIGLLFDEMI
ncbi:MAG: flagellar protein FlaG [Treponema sp.]|uniref:flagellar protein FlaG n=1 Tax=Treponema sp. TaxID=166 RepID=UPI002A91A174|nr:flagellar protein FlaG [Treponema sp.]MDY6398209.1 flagellar protein FlaG [Treponema sp.]